MHTSRLIQSILIISAAIVLSIWLGSTIVTDQFATLVKVAIGVLLLTSAFLGRRIWLLLIFFTSMNFVIYRWFGTTDIGQIIFISFSLILFLMRKLHFMVKIGELELWILMIVACIVQAYMRHPVGLNILGAGDVGGRPYVVLALSIVSSYILSTLRVPPREIKWAMYLTLIGCFSGIPLQIVRSGSPFGAEEGAARIPFLSVVANQISLWLSSRISPLRACLHPGWALLVLVTLAMAAGSGYRNGIASVGFTFLVGIACHGGTRSFLASLFLGVIALGLLAMINLVFPLPGIAQRALSPLPGTWEEQYRKDANDSTQWRVEMWKEALFTERWIQNKILGDGIGMTSTQLAQNMNMGGGQSRSGLLVQQENMLINGSYHSGPVHSVRMTGYVGLVILLCAMIRTAVHAHRQIVRCRGTEWFPVALYFGIPIITTPIIFVFIVGEYQTGVASVVFGMAIIRLMENNLPLPAWKKRVYEPYILRTNRNLPAPQPVRM